jgi:hypothetical protein
MVQVLLIFKKSEVFQQVELNIGLESIHTSTEYNLMIQVDGSAAS